MNRRFSQKERILIIILAIILVAAAYYLLVFQTSNNAIKKAEEGIAEVEDSLILEEVRNKQLREMRAALDTLEAGGHIAVIPQYDNTQNVVKLLDSALKRAIEYKLDFSTVDIGTKIATRKIQVSFTASSYTSAMTIIEQIAGGDYRCDVTSMNVTSAAQSDNLKVGEVKVAFTILFYELLTN